MRTIGARLAFAAALAAALGACASSPEEIAEEERLRRSVTTNIQLSAEYYRTGKLDVAIEKLQKALDIEPRHSQANNMMALIKLRLGELDAAEDYFEKALGADEQNAEAHNNFGVFLCERNRIDKSIKHFDKALAQPLYLTPGAANVNAGKCLMKKPDPAKAERYLRAALPYAAREPAAVSEALYQLAKLSYSTGRMMQARAFLQRHLQGSQDDNADSLLLAVQIERALGDKNAEASYALRLRSKFPNSPQARVIQGKQ